MKSKLFLLVCLLFISLFSLTVVFAQETDENVNDCSISGEDIISLKHDSLDKFVSVNDGFCAVKIPLFGCMAEIKNSLQANGDSVNEAEQFKVQTSGELADGSQIQFESVSTGKQVKWWPGLLNLKLATDWMHANSGDNAWRGNVVKESGSDGDEIRIGDVVSFKSEDYFIDVNTQDDGKLHSDGSKNRFTVCDSEGNCECGSQETECSVDEDCETGETCVDGMCSGFTELSLETFHYASDIRVDVRNRARDADLQSWIDEEFYNGESIDWNQEDHETSHLGFDVQVELEGVEIDLQSWVEEDIDAWEDDQHLAWHTGENIIVIINGNEMTLQDWIVTAPSRGDVPTGPVDETDYIEYGEEISIRHDTTGYMKVVVNTGQCDQYDFPCGSLQSKRYWIYTNGASGRLNDEHFKFEKVSNGNSSNNESDSDRIKSGDEVSIIAIGAESGQVFGVSNNKARLHVSDVGLDLKPSNQNYVHANDWNADRVWIGKIMKESSEESEGEYITCEDDVYFVTTQSPPWDAGKFLDVDVQGGRILGVNSGKNIFTIYNKFGIC